jgi:hypothetical protein
MLEFPFNQEMYDEGLVVRLPRSEIVELVLRAAGIADVSDEIAAELIAAVSKYSTATVAVGAYRRSGVPDCHCPASLAGYVRLYRSKWIEQNAPDNPGYLSHDDELDGFPGAFDTIVSRRHRRAMVIEVVNDDS